jgi:hypothetical protein
LRWYRGHPNLITAGSKDLSMLMLIVLYHYQECPMINEINVIARRMKSVNEGRTANKVTGSSTGRVLKLLVVPAVTAR